MPTIRINAFMIDFEHVEAAENAATLVFLHHGLGCRETWKSFPQDLARMAGCGYLVYSRHGYGQSSAASPPRSAAYMHVEATEVLPKLLAELGIPRPILIGHSDGASISLLYAGLFGAPLVATIVEAPHIIVEDSNLAAIRDTRTEYEQTDLREKLARYHGDNVDSAFYLWNESWLLPEFKDWATRDALPGIEKPLLAVRGDDDVYGSHRQLELIDALCAAPKALFTLPCGHAPHEEQRQACFELFTGFIDLVRGAGPSEQLGPTLQRWTPDVDSARRFSPAAERN